METLPAPQEDNKDWLDTYEWGPEPPMVMPGSEEEHGDDF